MDVEMINYTKYRSLKGCLCCLSHMMPNFFFNVALLNRFKENPTSEHLKVWKINFQTLEGDIKFCAMVQET